MSTPQVFEVCRSGFRLFCTGRYWPKMTILHIGAYSIRQAYYLAGRRVWDYPLGILECSIRGDPWSCYDGTTSRRPRFRPGESLPCPERQAVAS